MASGYYDIDGLYAPIDAGYPTYKDAIIGEIKIKRTMTEEDLNKYKNMTFPNGGAYVYHASHSHRTDEENKYGPEIVYNTIKKTFEVHGAESGKKGSLRNINLYDNVDVSNNFRAKRDIVAGNDLYAGNKVGAKMVVSDNMVASKDISAGNKVSAKMLTGNDVIGTHMQTGDIRFGNYGSEIKNVGNNLEIHGYGGTKDLKGSFINSRMTLYDDVTVNRDLTINRDANVGNRLYVKDLAQVNDMYVRGKLDVSKNANLNSLSVDNDGIFRNKLSVLNDANFNRHINVKGEVTANLLKGVNVIADQILGMKKIIGTEIGAPKIMGEHVSAEKNFCIGKTCINEADLTAMKFNIIKTPQNEVAVTVEQKPSQTITTAISQVAAAKATDVAVALNSAGNIFYANQNVTTNPNWTQIPGVLTNVSYSNKQLYGVNSAGDVYYNSNYTTGNWTKVPGKFTKVSFDGVAMIVVALNSAGNIFYANQNITTNPNWTQIPGVLTNVSYSNKQLYGVNSAGDVYYSPNYTTGNWTKVPGKMVQVSFDGVAMVVVALNSAGNIFYANQNITKNPNWTQIPGVLTNASYSNKQIYGVNSAGDVYYNSNYTTGNWNKLPGKMVQVSFN